MPYFSFSITNDDVALFLEWLKVKLDEKECYDYETITETIIDVVKRPHLYDDEYNKYKNQELANNG